MKEKFLIGEFARLFNISSDTLRYYDKMDILKPEYDEGNHYRYYNIRSIFKLSRILFLKNLEISLNEINKYMKNKNTDNLLSMLKKKDEELDIKIHQLMNLKHKIHSKLELLENYATEFDQIKVKTIDKRNGIFLDMNELKDEYEIKQEFKKSEKYLKISSWLVEGQIYTSLSKSNMDKGIFNRFRYFIETEIEPFENEIHQHLEVLPKNEYACIIVQGPYTEMVKHYRTLVTWIHENEYEIVGDSIEKNIIDYDFTESEIDYVSEIQIPIKKAMKNLG
jgi:DNA-binding transcriptional MerR regulator